MMIIMLININTYVFASNLNNVKATSYIIMDEETGQDLIEKNMKEKRFPASITKMLKCEIILK